MAPCISGPSAAVAVAVAADHTHIIHTHIQHAHTHKHIYKLAHTLSLFLLPFSSLLIFCSSSHLPSFLATSTFSLSSILSSFFIPSYFISLTSNFHHLDHFSHGIHSFIHSFHLNAKNGNLTWILISHSRFLRKIKYADTNEIMNKKQYQLKVNMREKRISITNNHLN